VPVWRGNTRQKVLFELHEVRKLDIFLEVDGWVYFLSEDVDSHLGNNNNNNLCFCLPFSPSDRLTHIYIYIFIYLYIFICIYILYIYIFIYLFIYIFIHIYSYNVHNDISRKLSCVWYRTSSLGLGMNRTKIAQLQSELWLISEPQFLFHLSVWPPSIASNLKLLFKPTLPLSPSSQRSSLSLSLSLSLSASRHRRS